jgi:hypothetical protein
LSKEKMKKILIITALCFVLLLCGTQMAASAATRTVDRTDDPNPVQTACTDAPNDCSLRGAINGATAGDTIDFASPLFDTAQTVTLTFGQLLVDTTLTIGGRAASLTAISGNNQSRIFQVNSPGDLRLNNLTLTDGVGGSLPGVSFRFGGAIWNNNGIIRINHSTISGNAVTGGEGGAIYNGGLVNLGGTLIVTSSTLSGNSCSGGGAIYSNGNLTLINSTVSGNSVNGDGGGIAQFGGAPTLINSTVTNNSSNRGGGVFAVSVDPVVIVVNTIISGNSASVNPNFFGTITAGGHNYINGDARLAPLGFYGGATQTHALLHDSPAINAGSECVLTANGCGDHAAQPTDQRGAARKTDTAVDIGAFERNITFDRTTLPGGFRSAAYNQTLTAARNDSPAAAFAFSIIPIAGQGLPPGLTLASNGTISGAPTQSGNFTFTVQATDAADEMASAQQYAIQIQSPLVISEISDRTIYEDASTGAISFTVGDAENQSNNLTITADSSNQTLVPNNAANITFGGANANRTIQITPAANQFGTTMITVTLANEHGLTSTEQFVLTVESVNDAPTFTRGADPVINEDAGAQTFNNWATNFSAGPPDEAGQTLDLNVSVIATTDNLAFSAAPAINLANGRLTFTPAPDTFGTATVSVRLSDNGSSAPPNVNFSQQTFVITVNSVNDLPTISAIGDQSVNPNTALTISFSVGDVETQADNLIVSAASSNQTLVPNSGIALGGAGANRTIQITPAADQSGVTTITVTATDADGGSFSRNFLVRVLQATVIVTNGNDGGPGSLREAVLLVTDGGTINFAPEVTLVTLTGGAILLERSVTINGTGANHLTVSGNNNSRIFDTRYPGPLAVTISGMTLSNGRTDDFGDGGAIRNFAAGVMNIANCTVSNNTADSGGGGIANYYGTMNISGSTISGNSSTFANGGGILHVEGQINIINSTISDNSAGDYQGGGVGFSGYYSGTVTIVNSTISRNHAFDGGGIFCDPVTLKNSIIALNTAASFPDIDGNVNSLDYNLIGNAESLFINGATAHNIYNQNPRLAPLGDYGGATQTFALLPDSPAIGAGDPNNVYNTDQRGVLRPAGDIDIGAFENSITFDQTSLPNGRTQMPYNFQLSATGQTSSAQTAKTGFGSSEIFAPAQFSTVFVLGEQLPPGLSLSQSGQISGTPTTGGNYTFTVKATDSDGMAGVRQFAIQIFAPTAASVSVSGKVLTPDGGGLINAMIMVTDAAGNTRIARTSSFGYYRFNDVAAGQTYIFTVVSKRYQFAPQVVNVMEDLTELNFTAQQ